MAVVGKVFGVCACITVVAEAIMTTFDALGSMTEFYRADATYWRDTAQTSHEMLCQMMSGVEVTTEDDDNPVDDTTDDERVEDDDDE